MGGEVGSGREFEADLFYLFLAGKVYMPRTARSYEAVAWATQGVEASIVSIASTLMNPPGFSVLHGARDTIQSAFSKTAVNVDEAADCLVQIALDYSETDAGVRDAFAQRLGELTGQDAADAGAPDTDPEPPS